MRVVVSVIATSYVVQVVGFRAPIVEIGHGAVPRN
jgi:hypothetical protein